MAAISKPATKLAIIGSGPGAVYALAHLLEAATPLDIDMFEAGPVAGVGLPYNARRNSKTMLANIASVELPPVRQTLLDWLTALSPVQRAKLGVEAAMLTEREFFPRVVLGAYFQSQLAQLVDQAAALGHRVRIRTLTPVLDVAGQPGSVFVRYRAPGGEDCHAVFDIAVVVTGHQAPQRAKRGPQPARPYQSATPTPTDPQLGILGSSLSAIDIAVAHADAFGAFTGEPHDLRYVPLNPQQPPAITMLSRGGMLPEADFYCPIPYEPLEIFTEQATAACIRKPEGGLDRLFALFSRQLAFSDPAYAVSIELGAASVDDFAARYFKAREACDPFAWAAANLAEVTANHRDCVTVAWRYALLRMHERFGELARCFTPPDLERFNRGIKRCFVDNYAAVPPLSIARILALRRAGVLDVIALGPAYELSYEPLDAGRNKWTITARAQHFAFSHLIDATGQGALALEDFPFPTLRMQIRAGQAGSSADHGGVSVDEDFELTRTLDDTSRIYCLSLPFLLRSNPFIQGLTASKTMGKTVAAAIIERISAPADDQRQDLRELIEEVAATRPIFNITGHAAIPVLQAG